MFFLCIYELLFFLLFRTEVQWFNLLNPFPLVATRLGIWSTIGLNTMLGLVALGLLLGWWQIWKMEVIVWDRIIKTDLTWSEDWLCYVWWDLTGSLHLRPSAETCNIDQTCLFLGESFSEMMQFIYNFVSNKHRLPWIDIDLKVELLLGVLLHEFLVEFLNVLGVEPRYAVASLVSLLSESLHIFHVSQPILSVTSLHFGIRRHIFTFTFNHIQVVVTGGEDRRYLM